MTAFALANGVAWAAQGYWSLMAARVLLALAGLVFGLPRGIGAGLPTATLVERLRAAAQSAVLLTLLVTTLWAMASYATYTYLAELVGDATTLRNARRGGAAAQASLSA